MRLFSALLIGAVFGIGIAISGMANPAKVINFFDFAGTWDPSLALVMGGALITTAVGYRVIFGRRARPLLEPAFSLPPSREFDARLIGGSALFGVGWGLSGFCPGGAIPALGLGEPAAFIFVAAMAVGIVASRLAPLKPLTRTASA